MTKSSVNRPNIRHKNLFWDGQGIPPSLTPTLQHLKGSYVLGNDQLRFDLDFYDNAKVLADFVTNDFEMVRGPAIDRLDSSYWTVEKAPLPIRGFLQRIRDARTFGEAQAVVDEPESKQFGNTLQNYLMEIAQATLLTALYAVANDETPAKPVQTIIKRLFRTPETMQSTGQLSMKQSRDTALDPSLVRKVLMEQFVKDSDHSFKAATQPYEGKEEELINDVLAVYAKHGLEIAMERDNVALEVNGAIERQRDRQIDWKRSQSQYDVHWLSEKLNIPMGDDKAEWLKQVTNAMLREVGQQPTYRAMESLLQTFKPEQHFAEGSKISDFFDERFEAFSRALAHEAYEAKYNQMTGAGKQIGL